MTMLLSAAFGATAQQQRRADRMEEMKTKRVAYVFQTAGLTTAEAEKLLPLYNEYKQKSWELGRERNASLKVKPGNTAEYEKASKNYINIRQKDADLAKEYDAKFRTVLSPEKLFKVYVAEWEFQRKAITRRK
jgi:hypothetical protein